MELPGVAELEPDRKSTRLNSSHLVISYAVFCLKKEALLGGRRWAVSLLSRILLHDVRCCVSLRVLPLLAPSLFLSLFFFFLRSRPPRSILPLPPPRLHRP